MHENNCLLAMLNKPLNVEVLHGHMELTAVQHSQDISLLFCMLGMHSSWLHSFAVTCLANGRWPEEKQICVARVEQPTNQPVPYKAGIQHVAACDLHPALHQVNTLCLKRMPTFLNSSKRKHVCIR